MKDRIEVDRQALLQVLAALRGSAYLINEIRAISSLRGDKCPIRKLVNDYQEATKND